MPDLTVKLSTLVGGDNIDNLIGQQWALNSTERTNTSGDAATVKVQRRDTLSELEFVIDDVPATPTNDSLLFSVAGFAWRFQMPAEDSNMAELVRAYEYDPGAPTGAGTFLAYNGVPQNEQVAIWDSASSSWRPGDQAGAAGGEINNLPDPPDADGVYTLDVSGEVDSWVLLNLPTTQENNIVDPPTPATLTRYVLAVAPTGTQVWQTELFTEAMGVKLAGIEEGAQANVGEEYTEDEKTKLAGIEANAQANVGVEYTQTEKTKLGSVESGAQRNVGLEYTQDDHDKLEGIESNAQRNVGVEFSSADKTKLDGIQSGAQANVGEEYTTTEKQKLAGIDEGAQANIGEEYTTAEKTKLAGIEAGAEVNPTDAEIGDKAFKNPPTLNAAQQQTARDAIGASAGGEGVEGLTAVSSSDDFTGSGTTDDPLGLTTPYTADEKTKLAGIETGAEVNNLPDLPAAGSAAQKYEAQVAADGTQSWEPASSGGEGENNNLPDAPDGDGRYVLDVASGVDSWAEERFTAADRTRFDGIESGAQRNVGQEYTQTEKDKLAGIAAGAQANVGEEYTTAEKTKLSGIETGAEVNNVPDVPAAGSANQKYEVERVTDGTLRWVTASEGGGTPVQAPTGVLRYQFDTKGEDSAFGGPRNWAWNYGNGLNGIDNGLTMTRATKVVSVGINFELNSAATGTWEVGLFINPTGNYDGTNNPPDASVITTPPSSASDHYQEAIDLATPLEIAVGERLQIDNVNSWAGTSPNISVPGTSGPQVRGTIVVTLEREITANLLPEVPTAEGKYELQVAADGTLSWVAASSGGGNGGGSTNLSFTRTGTTVTIVSSSGNDAEVPAASTTEAGVLSATDKTKLDGIESSAQRNVGEEYTSAEKTKLAGIAEGAQANIGEEYTTAEKTKLAGVETGAEVNVGEEYTSTEKSKLAGIEAGAQANVGVEYTATEKSKLGGIETGAQANVGVEYTQTEKTKLAGVEAGAQANVGVEYTQDEKTKLAGVDTGAEVNNLPDPPAATADTKDYLVRRIENDHPTNPGGVTYHEYTPPSGGGEAAPTDISIDETTVTVTVESSTGADGTIRAASASRAGVMTASDKSKLDFIEQAAERNNLPDAPGTDGQYVLDVASGADTWVTAPTGNSGTGGLDQAAVDARVVAGTKDFARTGGPNVPLSAIAGGDPEQVPFGFAWLTGTTVGASDFTGANGRIGTTGTRMVVPDSGIGLTEQRYAVGVQVDSAAEVEAILYYGDDLFGDDLNKSVFTTLTVNGETWLAWVSTSAVAAATLEGGELLVQLVAEGLNEHIDERIHDIIQGELPPPYPVARTTETRYDLVVTPNNQKEWRQSEAVSGLPSAPNAASESVNYELAVAPDGSQSWERAAAASGGSALEVQAYGIDTNERTSTGSLAVDTWNGKTPFLNAGSTTLMSVSTAFLTVQVAGWYLIQWNAIVGPSSAFEAYIYSALELSIDNGQSYSLEGITSGLVDSNLANTRRQYVHGSKILRLDVNDRIRLRSQTANLATVRNNITLYKLPETSSVGGGGTAASPATAYFWIHNQPQRWPDMSQTGHYLATRGTNSRYRMRWGQTQPREDYGDFAGTVSQNIWVGTSSINSNIDDPSPGLTFQVFTLPAGRYNIEVQLIYDVAKANFALDCAVRKVTSGVDDIVLLQQFGRQFSNYNKSTVDLNLTDLVVDGTEQFYVDSHGADETRRFGGFMKITKVG